MAHVLARNNDGLEGGNSERITTKQFRCKTSVHVRRDPMPPALTEHLVFTETHLLEALTSPSEPLLLAACNRMGDQ